MDKTEVTYDQFPRFVKAWNMTLFPWLVTAKRDLINLPSRR